MLEKTDRDVELRDPEDFDTLRQHISDGVMEEFGKSFPVSHGGIRLEVHNLGYEGPESFSLHDQKTALLGDGYLGHKLRGDLRLIDEASGNTLDEQRMTMLKVPYLTPRGTFINGGNEYVSSAQARLLPGVYTRRQSNGQLETQIVPKPGSGQAFRVGFEPDTAQYRLKVRQSNLHLYSMLHDLGVPDEQLEKQWGPEILAANKKKYDARVFPKAYGHLVRKKNQLPAPSRDDMVSAIHDALNGVQVHERTARVNLPNMFDTEKSAEWQAQWVGRTAAEELMFASMDFDPDISPQSAEEADDMLKIASIHDEFSPDLGRDDIHEEYNSVVGKCGPRFAGMKEWPKSWFPPGSNQLGWLAWYRKYADGHRTDDDDRQIKRWKSFKARNVSRFVSHPTARMALSLRHWAIDPMKLLPDAEAKDKLQGEMDEYRAERTKEHVKCAMLGHEDIMAIAQFLNTKLSAGINIQGTSSEIEQEVMNYIQSDANGPGVMPGLLDYAVDAVPKGYPNQPIKVAADSKKRVCHAVDLDSTLAEHNTTKPFDINHVGKPVKVMMDRVKKWLDNGDKVVIFTARASSERNKLPVRAWLQEHGLPELEITNIKKPEFTYFHDDRAVSIEPNTGKVIKHTIKEASVLADLKLAKKYSDAGRYGAKQEVLFRLMHTTPDNFQVDEQGESPHWGVTHIPTGFQFHINRSLIPAEIVNRKEPDIMLSHHVSEDNLDSVKQLGLVSREDILAKHPDILARIAKEAGRTPDEQRVRFQELMKDRPHQGGVSALFADPPDDAPLPDNHPFRLRQMAKVRINLTKFLHDHPDVKPHGVELTPWTENGKWQDRHRDMTQEDLRIFSKKTPQELWGSFNDIEGKGLYAPDVPHVIIPKSIPKEYLEFPEQSKEAGALASVKRVLGDAAELTSNAATTSYLGSGADLVEKGVNTGAGLTAGASLALDGTALAGKAIPAAAAMNTSLTPALAPVAKFAGPLAVAQLGYQTGQVVSDPLGSAERARQQNEGASIPRKMWNFLGNIPGHVARMAVDEVDEGDRRMDEVRKQMHPAQPSKLPNVHIHMAEPSAPALATTKPTQPTTPTQVKESARADRMLRLRQRRGECADCGKSLYPKMDVQLGDCCNECGAHEKSAAETVRRSRFVEEIDEHCPHCDERFYEKYGPIPDDYEAAQKGDPHDYVCPKCNGSIDARQLTDEEIEKMVSWLGPGCHERREKYRAWKKEKMEKQAKATDWKAVEADRQLARDNTEEPKSPEQAAAGNYPKGRFKWNGLTIVIETKKDGERSGTSKDGKAWKCKMVADYGYVSGNTSDADGDGFDIFAGPDLSSPVVFVIDQNKGPTDTFDEHKAVIGASSEEEAKQLYMDSYSKGWKGFRSITPLTVPQFKEWISNGHTGKALADQKVTIKP